MPLDGIDSAPMGHNLGIRLFPAGLTAWRYLLENLFSSARDQSDLLLFGRKSRYVKMGLYSSCDSLI